MGWFKAKLYYLSFICYTYQRKRKQTKQLTKWLCYVQVLKDGLSTLHVPYSYGFAIILLTILVKAATFPLTKKQVSGLLSCLLFTIFVFSIFLCSCHVTRRSRFEPWKQPLVEMQGKVMYDRPLCSGLFPDPAHSGSFLPSYFCAADSIYEEVNWALQSTNYIFSYEGLDGLLSSKNHS